MTNEEEVAFKLGRSEAILDVKILIAKLAKGILEDEDEEIKEHRLQIAAVLGALINTIDHVIK